MPEDSFSKDGITAIMSRSFVIAFAVFATQAGAQRSSQVRLSSVIAAFLADSGVLTRGLPWTTGKNLPIKWQSTAPVANPDVNARGRGMTLARFGAFTGTVGDSVPLKMTIALRGTSLGLASMAVTIPGMDAPVTTEHGYSVTREMVEQALRNEGLKLTPLKCSRDREGASYGNLVDVVKSPGKTASGLWWYWDSPRQEMFVTLTLLYRRADMGQVECQ